MKGCLGPIGLGMVIFVIWGCTTTQDQALMQQRLAILEQRVVELEHKTQATEEKDKAIADIYSRLDAMQLRMGKIEGQLEEYGHRLGEFQGQPPTTVASVAPPEDARTQPPSQPVNPEEALYEEALKSFQKKEYNLSEQKFKEFLERYPNSSLADNSLFWLGEIYYIRGNYLKAIEYYQQVIDNYPKENKVLISLYKQAKAWEAIGDTTAARILYEKVIEKAPNSSEARLAKRDLEALGNSPPQSKQ